MNGQAKEGEEVKEVSLPSLYAATIEEVPGPVGLIHKAHQFYETPQGEKVERLTPHSFVKIVVLGDKPRYVPVKSLYKNPPWHISTFIYEMLDTQTERHVAAKAYLWGMDFEEMRLLAKLEHPNIIQVYDMAVEKSSGTRYMIMELAEGGNLVGWIEQNHTVEEVLSVINQVAAGVHYINQKGLAYCDLKPWNVVAKEDRVKIIDVANCALLDENGVGRCTLGAYGFKAPEQNEGDGRVTVRSDVYSFAVLVFSIFGQDPNIWNIEGFRKGEYQLVPLGTDFQGKISSQTHQKLSKILRQGLAQNPASRQSTVVEINKELQECLAKPVN